MRIFCGLFWTVLPIVIVCCLFIYISIHGARLHVSGMCIDYNLFLNVNSNYKLYEAQFRADRNDVGSTVVFTRLRAGDAYNEGLVQDCSISIANALEILQYYT